MYKNWNREGKRLRADRVSILVLMELCIKTKHSCNFWTILTSSFNPCFNGTMYKNFFAFLTHQSSQPCFNPCFNGTMYKNCLYWIWTIEAIKVSILVLMELCIKTNSLMITRNIWIIVSILVLMELCIKTNMPVISPLSRYMRFNPCFNGTMYKNAEISKVWSAGTEVSILVLMELCIKTRTRLNIVNNLFEFQSLF